MTEACVLQSLGAAGTEPVCLESALRNVRSRCNKKLAHHMREQPPLQHATTKSQHNQKYIKLLKHVQCRELTCPPGVLTLGHAKNPLEGMFKVPRPTPSISDPVGLGGT